MSNSNSYLWSAINRIGVQIIGFVGNILLARLLTPNDYGLIAMLSIVIGISWNFVDSGFADYLIRKQDASEKDLGIVLTHNVSVSVLFFVILYFSAPSIAQFFDRNELILITRLLGFSVIIKAFSIVETTRMRKNLEFKKFAIIQILSSIISLVLAYISALLGFGYFALIVQTISLGICNFVLMVLINKWIPKFYFNWEEYKKMRKFGNDMLFSYFSNQIGQNIYSVFIGKFHSSISLGNLSQANKVNDASFQGLNAIILTTSYPIIAKEKDRAIRLKKYKELAGFFLYIHFFLSFFIIGSANELIPILFGVKWINTSFFLQLTTLSTLFFPLMTINANITKTENRTKIYRNLTFVRNGLTLFSLLLTYKLSITHILSGLIISRFLSVFLDMVFCGRLINFGFFEQIKIVLYQLLTPLISTLVAYLFSTFFSDNLIVLIVYFCVYVFIFFVTNVLIKNVVQKIIFAKVFNKLNLNKS
jgi:teichuronic acid exporter